MVIRPFSHTKKEQLTEEEVVEIILSCRAELQRKYPILIGIVI